MHNGMNAGLVTLGTLPHPPEILKHWITNPNWVAADHPAGTTHPQICVNQDTITLQNHKRIAWSTVNAMVQGMINSKLACQHKQNGLDSAPILWTHLESTFDEFSVQEIIPAGICAILMLCMMPKNWEETQNTLLHTHHNNLTQLTPDVIG
ncbi:hypothetical protein P691DRAFT_789532 [Macrolepiota fuliginosa MF-IS2]|uniref:Uncharacterized protein n=1 Tax=Macrolepiota fuliginosa MF-IS2 TaxID=1400762 RepID=A0A9P5X092_9AGAR|nr:hypothetical protein P691DRAFT_789532 [Macrolepiota fuliginosa MF-IS2]